MLQIGTKEKKELSTYLVPKKIELHFFTTTTEGLKEVQRAESVMIQSNKELETRHEQVMVQYGPSTSI